RHEAREKCSRQSPLREQWRQKQASAETILRLIVEVLERGRKDSRRVRSAVLEQERLVFAQHRRDFACGGTVHGGGCESGGRHGAHAQLQYRIQQSLSESHAAPELRELATDPLLRNRAIERTIHEYANLDVAADFDPRCMQRHERNLACTPPQARRFPTDPATGPPRERGEQLAPIVHVRSDEPLGLVWMRARLCFERGEETICFGVPRHRAHGVIASTPPLVPPSLASRWSPCRCLRRQSRSRIHPVFPWTTDAACRTSRGRSPSWDRGPRRRQRI